MTGLPNTQVLLDNGTGSFPFDITSKVLLIDGIKFSRGRGDWQSAVTAGELTLTLNNADGRFTPGSTFYASPTPIKVDQRIRVKETVNGTVFTRFTGYVKSWPVSWPATVATHSTVSITVTDAQARAERWPLKSFLVEEVERDSADFLYLLDEAAGTTGASDSMGHYPPAVANAYPDVTFGYSVDLPSGTVPAARFGYLGAIEVTVPEPAWVTAIVQQTAGDPRGGWFTNFNTTNGLALGLTISTGLPKAQAYGLTATGSVAINDGRPHILTAAITPGASGFIQLFVDKVLVATSATGPITLSGSSATLLIAGATASGNQSYVARVAGGHSPITSTRALAQQQASLDAFAGESGTARITRLAGYGGLPLGTLDASLTNVAATDIAGRSAWDAIQEVADAEGGVAYFDGSGNLTFHNRNRVVSKTAPDITLDKQYVTSDIAPTVDDQQLINHFEATAQGTGVVQLVKNDSSEVTHGRYPESRSYLVQFDFEALDRANWIVGNLAEPITRYGTLTINMWKLHDTSPSRAAAVLTALDLGMWLRVSGMPSQNTDGGTTDVVVEGYSEEISATTWRITCNVVSKNAGLYAPVLIPDDPVYGLLDTPNSRLYY